MPPSSGCPQGSYELKVAINHSWDESYGQGSGNVPLVLAGPATLRFTYDDTTHAIGVAPTDLPGAATKADSKLAGPVAAQRSRRRSASTSSWPTASPTATRPTTRAA